jgi:hypothetical protein
VSCCPVFFTQSVTKCAAAPCRVTSSRCQVDAYFNIRIRVESPYAALQLVSATARAALGATSAHRRGSPTSAGAMSCAALSMLLAALVTAHGASIPALVPSVRSLQSLAGSDIDVSISEQEGLNDSRAATTVTAVAGSPPHVVELADRFGAEIGTTVPIELRHDETYLKSAPADA